MATYQDIKGLRVKYLSADPSNLAAGQVWYNSTTSTLKSLVASAAWSSGSPLATARDGMGGFGVQTAAICAGGETTVAVGNTEEYNGSGWETKTAMNTANRAVTAVKNPFPVFVAVPYINSAIIYSSLFSVYLIVFIINLL